MTDRIFSDRWIIQDVKALLVGFSLGALFGTASVTFSQEPLLIEVDLRGSVSRSIARHIKVDAGQIPETVQAPITVATLACKKSADLLSAQAKSGAGSCTAIRTTADLERIVLERIKSTTQK